MTRDAASWDDLCAAARRAWDAVPAHLRTTKRPRAWGTAQAVFSDRSDR
jgi:hypothetical protein